MTAATSPSSTIGDAIDVVGDWSPGDKLLVADMDGRSRIVQVRAQGPRLDR